MGMGGGAAFSRQPTCPITESFVNNACTLSASPTWALSSLSLPHLLSAGFGCWRFWLSRSVRSLGPDAGEGLKAASGEDGSLVDLEMQGQ